MKKLKSLMIVLLAFLVLHSCSDNFEEQVEIVDSAEMSGNGSTIKPLDQIDNALLPNQLRQSKEHVKGLIAKEFDHLLIEHNLNDMSLDTDHVVIVKNDDETTSYSLFLTVPQENGQTALNLNGYLTLNFDAEANLGNELQFGYQLEYDISFDQNGHLVTVPATEYGGYTPKPSNIASKAPKYIVCQYVYCGYNGWSGAYGPTPQYILDMFPWLQNSYDIDDLTVLTKNWYEPDLYPVIFSQFNSTLKNDYITFYDRERMDYSYGGQKTYWNNFGPKVLGHHVHKKAFIDSFQRWLFKSLDPANAQTTYVFMVQNPTVLSQVFNLFADYNLQADTEDGAYLEIPYGGYSTDPNVRCLNQGSQFLLSAAGRDLLQDLADGVIDIDGFRAALPGCD